MRQQLIAANWKMYKTPHESVSFLETFTRLLPPDLKSESVLFPSTTSLPALAEVAKGSSIRIGAQNMHWLDAGAYTGETSPTMLLALGVTHVLIGHSERRQYFNESDETVNLKLKAAIAHSLIPIVCVGEHLEQRESGQTSSVLERQVLGALTGIDPANAGSIVFAYEPIWAIGTGRTATPEIAEDAHKLVRGFIAKGPRGGRRAIHPHPLRRLRQTR